VRSLALFSIVTLGLSAFSAVGQASIIFSENFNSVPDGLNKTGTIGNFTVTTGNVDVLGTNPTNEFSTLCVSPETGNCIDLDGSKTGAISSTSISVTPGSYILAFDLNGSQRGSSTSTTVTFAGFTHTYVLASASTNAFSIPLTITTAGTSKIVFTSNTSGSRGSLIDNVSLSNVTRTAGVPEPATGLLMLGGLALAVITRRRRSPKIG
jgi:hypothetical protein